MTDALGRKFMRFDGSQYLDIPTGSIPSQNFAFFMVGRVHRPGPGNGLPIWSMNTGTNGGRAQVFVGNGTTTDAPYLAGATKVASSTTNGNAKNGIVGSQLQVIGVVHNSGGGQRLYVNSEVNLVASSNGGSAAVGSQLGRFILTPGSAGAWALMDVYEYLVYDTAPSTANCDAIAAALVAGWQIPAITNSLILEGDSITQGINDVLASQNPGMGLTDPGGPYAMPGSWRVVTAGVSGNMVSSLVTRRDSTNSMFQSGAMLSGRNVIAVMVGVNDVGTAGNATYGGTTFNTSARADAVYTAYTALLNTTTTGYLQRGFEVVDVINIAANSNFFTGISQLRTRKRAGAFLTDTLSGAGQTYDGKVSHIELPALLDGSAHTIFDVVGDAANLTYYQVDSLHPSVVGSLQIARGYRAAF